MGSHLIQNPPSTKVLDYSKDTYTYEQIRDFVFPFLPNFYRELNNLEEYEDFLLPRYSPKIIAFIREDEDLPLALKQIGVAFFLRIDVICWITQMALITDLNEELLGKFPNITKFPSFVILKYNYNTSEYEYHYPRKFDLEEDYEQIKKFVTPFALKETRNDLVFHKI